MTTLTYDNDVSPGDIIAVGDIHGRYDLLSSFVDYARGSQSTVIFLGDLIDRGGDDLAVLNKVKQLLDDPDSEGLANVFALMGNHEAMFVDALTGPFTSLFLWLQNGGNFEQYDEMGEHLEWIADLPVYMTIGETMFIHAGFYPGKNPFDAINAGKTDNILWMREPFLTYGPEFEKWNPDLKQVIFGHTPKFDEGEGKPYTIPGGGICIDTGAFFTNILTSYNVTQNTFCQHTVKENAEPLTAH